MPTPRGKRPTLGLPVTAEAAACASAVAMLSLMSLALANAELMSTRLALDACRGYGTRPSEYSRRWEGWLASETSGVTGDEKQGTRGEERSEQQRIVGCTRE